MSTEFWPGTKLPRSTDNAFCGGWTGKPVDWSHLTTNHLHKTNSARRVQKLRDAGTPIDSIHGISRKADDQIAMFAARRNAKRAPA